MEKHPRLKFLHKSTRRLFPARKIDNQLLLDLREHGATITEATIILHLYYHFKQEDADKIVIDSGIFPYRPVDEAFWQTMEYLFFDGNSPL